MPGFTSYSREFGNIHSLGGTIHLVSVLVSVLKRGWVAPNYFRPPSFLQSFLGEDEAQSSGMVPRRRTG
jgi:hypothetical protein